MSQRNFPDFIEAYLNFTSGHEGTPRCHLWSIISVIAASLERKVWLDRGYYTLFPNLYVFIIGKSGLIKKSTTTGIAVDLFRELSDMKMMSERLTAASLINQLNHAHTSFVHKEKPVSQSAVFAYASELSVFMTEVQGTITELLTTFYDCIPHDSSKPWIYDTKTTGVQKIFGPCLNILGASTQAWLKKCIPASEMEGGFTSRVVFVVENKGPDTVVAWPKVDESKRAMRTKLVEDLATIHSLVGEVEVTDKARALFSKWYEFHMRNVVPDCSDPKMSGYLGRKGDLLLKLAMIRSVTLRNDLRCDEQDMFWAGDILENIEPEMKASFEGLGASVSGEITYEIRNYIRNRGNPVDKAELKRAFAKNAPGYEVERCLEDLLEMGEIAMTEKKEDGILRMYFSPRVVSGP